MTNLNLDPDDLILSMLAADDPRAVNKLFEHYYKRLFFHVRKLTRNDHDTASILNDLFADIWKKRHSLKLHKPLGNYLYRAAHYRALNFLRDKGNFREIPTEPELLASRMEDTGPEADSGLLLEDLRILWQIAELYMTPRTRETFLMSRQQQMTYAEIAAALGISVSAVEKHIARALSILERIKRLFLTLVPVVFLLTF